MKVEVRLMNKYQETMLEQHFPRKGDVLLKPAGPHTRGLLTDPLGFKNLNGYCHSSEDMYLYERGYKRAAEFLLQGAVDQHPCHPLILPILFLYRHYVELSLKSALRDASQFMIDATVPACDHNLLKLWKQLKGILPVAWPQAPPDQVEAVEACINEMCEHDPASMAFRYPTDREGNPHLEKLQSIDLLNLKDVMHGVGNFLDCVGEAIAQQLEFRREINGL